MKKILSLLLALLMIAPAIVSCSNQTSGEETSGSNTSVSADENTAPEETEAPDPFADVDFGGREFRVYTSVDTTDATNADSFIRGTGETNGEIVNDAVFDRNMAVSELLNITLKFTEASYTYSTAEQGLKNLVMAGADEYDVITNDLFILATLSSGNYLRNVYNSTVLDLDQSYWYGDAMRDLQFIEGGIYLLLGDYFTDALASAHALFANESVLEDHFGSTEYINDMVFSGTWTMDNMTAICESVALDSNGDGQMTEGDFFGFTCIGTWGSAIPALIGTDVQFVERTDGGIQFCFNNERSVTILEKLNKMYWNNGALTSIADYSAAGLRQVFANGQTLIMGYNRIGDLANLRDIEFGVGILPYPKLDETQENYVTSLHDTTEVGAILSTLPTTSEEFVHTCLEVFSRETSRTVIPQWYENALKVKYVDGQDDAKMIDLIHDTISSPFAVAYNKHLNDFHLGST
ncbi:MAG: hypothetical protein ACI4V1_02080, partial [Eubacteriales bacterium]